MLRRMIRNALRFADRLINAPIKRSEWYKGLFLNYRGDECPNDAWYRKNHERNFDFLVLGSSMAYWGIDLSDAAPLRGVKLAHAPQYLINDYRLLKNYFSIVRDKGTVIITLSPFSSIDTPEDELAVMRYLKVYQNADLLLPRRLYRKAQRYAAHPILMGRTAIKAGLYSLIGRGRCSPRENGSAMEENPLSEEQLKSDAKRWIEGWKAQFAIADLDYPLMEENVFGREYRLSILRKMIDFCRVRNLRPVVVYLPVSRFLRTYFTPKMRQTYVESFLHDLARDVETHNYLMDEEFSAESLYFNSFFLNKRGRRLFTERLMKDLFH